MPHNKKMFVFDLDGTFLSVGNEVLDTSIEAIKRIKEQGHWAVIATGRPLWDIINIVKGHELFDYIICNNGSYCFDSKTQRNLFFHEMSQSVAKTLITIGKEYSALFALHTKSYTNRYYLATTLTPLAKQIIDQEWKAFGKIKTLQDLALDFGKEPIAQASLRTSKEQAVQIYDQLRKKLNDKVAITISGEVYIDVNIKGCNKFAAIAEVMKKHDIKDHDVYAFGDSNNDVEMLKYCGNSFCMGNGTKAAKAVAKNVIGSNLTSAILDQVNLILHAK